MSSPLGKKSYVFRYDPPKNVAPIVEILGCCGEKELAWSNKWQDFWDNRDPLDDVLADTSETPEILVNGV